MNSPKHLISCVVLTLFLSLSSCDKKSVVPQLSEEQVREFQARAEAGDYIAQYNLAQCYLSGQPGLPESNENAHKLILQSALSGFPKAQLQLGGGYAKGTPETPKDLNTAHKWSFLALAGGEEEAEAKIKKLESSMTPEQIDTNRRSSFMIYALEVQKDIAVPRLKILDFYAHKGVARAQCELGDSYLQGFGVVKDFSQAIKWYSQAATEGHTPAEVFLGQAYADGVIVPKDPVQSAKWYLRAANKGDLIAQSAVAMAYAEGTGVPLNAVEAYKWWNIASVNPTGPDDDGKLTEFRESMARCRDIISEKMKPEQVKEAQQRSRDWRPFE